jgi:hypothetical protein
VSRGTGRDRTDRMATLPLDTRISKGRYVVEDNVQLRPSDFDRNFDLRQSTVMDLIQHMRWLWWDEHHEHLPGMARYPLNPDASSSTGTVTRAVHIYTEDPQRLSADLASRRERLTQLEVRAMPREVGHTSAT